MRSGSRGPESTAGAEPYSPDLHPKQPRAIHSALVVLEEVARAGPGVTARELSERLGLPRATTYRLVNLLVQDEYLVRLGDMSGFALGRKVADLASAVGLIAPAPIPLGAREILAGLRASWRTLGVHLIRIQGDRLILADLDPDVPLTNPSALVAELERSAAGRLLRAELGPLRTERPNHAVQVDALSRGTACVAHAVRAPDGTLIAAVCASAPTSRRPRLDEIVPELAAAAAALSRYLA